MGWVEQGGGMGGGGGFFGGTRWWHAMVAGVGGRRWFSWPQILDLMCAGYSPQSSDYAGFESDVEGLTS